MCDIDTAREEERRLIARARQGDRNAIDAVVALYLPMIAAAAGRFRVPVSVLPKEELTQAGVIGLLQALYRFSPEAGVRLGTYAMSWILGEMRRAIGKAVDPTGAYPARRRIERAQEQLQAVLSRSPTVAELAAACNMGEGELSEIVSLCYPVYDGGEEAGGSVFEHIEAGDGGQERAEIALALGALTEDERIIIILRYFRDRTQAETARMTGKSQAQVSRIERRALDRLRDELV